jgi:hypothetical protein
MSPLVSARAGMASWIRLWLRIYNLIYRVWKRSIQQASGAHACYRFWGRHLMLVRMISWDRQTRFRAFDSSY